MAYSVAQMNTKWDDLYACMENGYLPISAVEATGISRSYVTRFIDTHKKDLVKIRPGLYRNRAAFPDPFFEATYAIQRAILSHETALYLHGQWEDPLAISSHLALYTDIPSPLTVTVPRGYNASHLRARGLHVVTIPKEKWQADHTTVRTPFGHEVACYTLERARNDVGIPTVDERIRGL